MSMPLVSGLSVTGMTSHTSVDNYVCNVGWNALQAMPFGPLTPDNAIDKAIATGKQFHVRLNLGRYSPIWAGEITGVGNMTIIDPQDGNKGQVPIWWDDVLQLAQANLIARLADKYDGIIPAIYMGTNMTIYCEPFIRQIGSRETRQELEQFGYSEDIDKTSYYNCLYMFDAFQETRVAWAFNPYQSIDAVGAPINDESFTENMITEMRLRFSDSIIQNNSIRFPSLKSYDAMYTYMKGHKPLNFQTATMQRVGDLAKTLDWAIMMGANRVELNPGYETHLSAMQLKNYDKALKANA